MKARRRRKAIKKLMTGRPVTWREWRAIRLDSRVSLTYSLLCEMYKKRRQGTMCWIEADSDLTIIGALSRCMGQDFEEWKNAMLRQIAEQFGIPSSMLLIGKG